MTGGTPYRTLRASEALLRAAPLHVEPQAPRVFADEARAYATSPEAGLYEVPHGRMDRFGQCRDRWGRLVPWNARSLPRGQTESAARWRLPGTPARRCAGRVAGLTHARQQAYFHWLFDVLPRYALLEQSGTQADAAYLDQSQEFQRASWAMLGARLPLIDAADCARVGADLLLVPSAPSVSGVMPPWVCGWLRERLGAAAQANGPRERLYISRAGVGTGTVRNEDALQALLSRHGFTTLRSEMLPLARQIELFARAEMVIGPHGAGLANLVFAPSGCRVIELFAPACINVCYWTLACQLDLHYAFCLASAVDGAGGPLRPDLSVDLGKLARLLERMDIAAP